jgi:hypothetical protein
MITYGVCPNSPDKCPLSYKGEKVQRIRELLDTIQAREARSEGAGMLEEQLRRFAVVFQPNNFCSVCGSNLFTVTKPLPSESDDTERHKIAALNTALVLGYQLEARKVLPFE